MLKHYTVQPIFRIYSTNLYPKHIIVSVENQLAGISSEIIHVTHTRITGGDEIILSLWISDSPWSSRYDWNSFHCCSFLPYFIIPLNWSPSLRFRGINPLLTFCWCCLAIPLRIYLLVGFITLTLVDTF